MDSAILRIRRLPHAADLPLPQYMTVGAAGMDLLAANASPMLLLPGTRALVPTGLQMAVPYGYEVQIRPRSGLALKRGICIVNSPGTIDPDYRGEVKVIVANLGNEPFVIGKGSRIAQMVLARVAAAELVECEELPKTERGEGGFGHTGK